MEPGVHRKIRNLKDESAPGPVGIMTHEMGCPSAPQPRCGLARQSLAALIFLAANLQTQDAER